MALTVLTYKQSGMKAVYHEDNQITKTINVLSLTVLQDNAEVYQGKADFYVSTLVENGWEIWDINLSIFSEKEIRAMRTTAWHLHKRTEADRRLASLQAPIMAKALGRSLKDNHYAHFYCAEWGTDAITCGCDLVWKTGGQKIIQFCLAITSFEDLELRDYTEELMWRQYIKGRRDKGLPFSTEGRWNPYRNGEQLSDLERQAILDAQEAKRGRFAACGVSDLNALFDVLSDTSVKDVKPFTVDDLPKFSDFVE